MRGVRCRWRYNSAGSAAVCTGQRTVGVQHWLLSRRACLQFIDALPLLPCSFSAYKFELDPEVEKIYTTVRKTHNQGECGVWGWSCALRRADGTMLDMATAGCFAAQLPKASSTSASSVSNS